MQLTVTVHLDHVDFFMVAYEIGHLLRKRYGTDAHKICLDTSLRQVEARLLDGWFRRTECNDSDVCRLHCLNEGFWYVLARRFEFLTQAQHVAFVLCRAFGITGEFIMTSAACEPGAARIAIAWDRPVCDPISIDVHITRPLAIQLLQVFFPEDFAAVHRFSGVFKWLGHPLVHPDVQVAQHQNRHLQSFSEVEGAPTKFKALVCRARQEDNVLRISVSHEIHHSQVSLGGTGGRARAGSYTLNVPDYHRHPSVIGQTDILAH